MALKLCWVLHSLVMSSWIYWILQSLQIPFFFLPSTLFTRFCTVYYFGDLDLLQFKKAWTCRIHYAKHFSTFSVALRGLPIYRLSVSVCVCVGMCIWVCVPVCVCIYFFVCPVCTYVFVCQCVSTGLGVFLCDESAGVLLWVFVFVFANECAHFFSPLSESLTQAK